MNMMPSQNPGIDWLSMAKNMPSLSQSEPGRSAETIPIGIPSSTAIAIAAKANSNVAGSRSPTNARTGV